MWTAEAWGSDALTPLAYLAAVTDRIQLGTSVVQLAARTPTATAMSAITLDYLSNGRLRLGLGVSGPQVVEGWYGRPSDKPLARTREYVEIIRRVVAREEPLDFQGEFFQHPYSGDGSVGLGKPLKSIVHPMRRHIPIYLGAEGPKNVAQTAEIADGWLPLYYSPYRQEVYADQLAGAADDFEVASICTFAVTPDDKPETLEAALAIPRAMLAFYIGGMGAKGQNYHTKLAARMGLGKQAEKIQDMFFEGKRDEAVGGGADRVRRRDLPRRHAGPHRGSGGGMEGVGGDRDPRRGRQSGTGPPGRGDHPPGLSLAGLGRRSVRQNGGRAPFAGQNRVRTRRQAGVGAADRPSHSGRDLRPADLALDGQRDVEQLGVAVVRRHDLHADRADRRSGPREPTRPGFRRCSTGS